MGSVVRLMVVRLRSGKGLYGASLALGVLAAADLVFMFLPKMRPFGRFIELIQLYLERLHPALGVFAGNSMLLQLIAICALVWLASWAALEAFSRATDGFSLWGNISEDSCGMTARGVRRAACTACKWVLTLLVAPTLIVLALARRARYGTCNVTVAFVTFDPAIVMMYIRHMLIGLGLVAGAVVLALA